MSCLRHSTSPDYLALPAPALHGREAEVLHQVVVPLDALRGGKLGVHLPLPPHVLLKESFHPPWVVPGCAHWGVGHHGGGEEEEEEEGEEGGKQQVQPREHHCACAPDSSESLQHEKD